MRLLKHNGNGEFSLNTFFGDRVPPYAILSHTWGIDDEEVTFHELMRGTGKSKPGYSKVQFCASQAESDGLQYFWIDTCCINKGDSVELQEAINSMFRWYQDAAKCYIYLSDVVAQDDQLGQLGQFEWESAFRNSRWFTRGWTLQELLAPRSVEFFSRNGVRLCNKYTLEKQIHEITGIPVLALQGAPLSNFSVEDRLSWASNRQTKCEEDHAYCLLGIFNVSLPIIYGEGKENAFRRLQYEIQTHADFKPQPTEILSFHAPGSPGIHANRGSMDDLYTQHRQGSIDEASIASADTWGSGVTIEPAINDALIEEFATVILEDKVLRSILSMSCEDSKVTSQRLERNFTRLLRLFSKNLRQEAISKDHIAVASFVGSRARLTSRLVCSRAQSMPSNKSHDMTERTLLERYLRTLPVFASSESAVNASKDEDDDESEEEKDDQDSQQSFEDHDEISELSKVQKFLIGGAAWRHFQNVFLDWVCPPWSVRVDHILSQWLKPDNEPCRLQQVIMVADDISNVDPRTLVVDNGEYGIFNDIKGRVERWTCQPWDWWPLSPYCRALSDLERRLTWTCACGERQAAIVPRDLALGVQKLAKEFLTDELKASEQGIDLHIIPYDAESDPEASQTNNRSVLHEASSNVDPTTRLGFTLATSGRSQDDPAAECKNAAPRSAITANERHISFLHLFFVVARSGEPKFEQKVAVASASVADTSLECITNDRSLYHWIRRAYIKHRGWFHYYLGVKQFDGCDFYQFNHYAARTVAPHSEIRHEFPADLVDEYIFKRVKQFPPISRHEFKQQVVATATLRQLLHRTSKLPLLKFLKALFQGTWSVTISPKGFEFHDKTPQLPTTRLNFSGSCRRSVGSALERLPKRKSNIVEESDELDIFLGIYSREKISARHFIGWFMFLCIPSLIFAFVFLFDIGDRRDLQNAFTVMGVTLPFLTILFSPFIIPETS